METSVSAKEYWWKVRTLGREAFSARHSNTFLLGLFSLAETGPLKFATLSGETDHAQNRARAGFPAPVPDSEVIPLLKRAGVSLADKITVGRTQNNDIVIRDLLVSKLHGFFTVNADGKVGFTDSGSSNGTQLDGQPLPAFESVRLESGSVITFGTQASFLHLSAEDLYQHLYKMLEPGNVK